MSLSLKRIWKQFRKKVKAENKKVDEKKADDKKAEKKAEKQDRRNRYYRDDPKTQNKRRPHIYLFRQEDLDNEDVILAVENTPTYKRTRQTLEEIRRQASGITMATEDKKEPVQGVISFSDEG